MKVACSSEAFVSICKFTWCHYPENQHRHLHLPPSRTTDLMFSEISQNILQNRDQSPNSGWFIRLFLHVSVLNFYELKILVYPSFFKCRFVKVRKSVKLPFETNLFLCNKIILPKCLFKIRFETKYLRSIAFKPMSPFQTVSKSSLHIFGIPISVYRFIIVQYKLKI